MVRVTSGCSENDALLFKPNMKGPLKHLQNQHIVDRVITAKLIEQIALLLPIIKIYIYQIFY